MFIRGGYNVFPLEVEAVLASHPEVVDVVVVPRPDPVMGEIGVAVVIPRDPAHPPTLDALRQDAGARLASHKLPEALRIVDDLPLTPMQKVDRQALADHERGES
jgi:acyl-CoA synthetase (AMP-forming)/AMP-acid ligase II